MSRAFSFVGMLAVLSFSYGLDRIWELVRQENSRTFNIMPSLWLSGVFDLAFAAAILGLAWFVLFKGAKSLPISLIFFFAGLLLLSSYPLWGLLPGGSLEPFLGSAFRLFTVPPTTYEYHAAAFIAMMGAAGVIRNMQGMVAGTRPIMRDASKV